MVRKLLSLMLCLCMTLTLVPDWSFAAAEGENINVTETQEVQTQPEQTEEPAKEPKKAANLSEDASFKKGYVKTLGRATLYTSSKGDEYELKLNKGAIGFSLSRPNAGKAYDRLKVAVNINGKHVVGYVVAKNLVALTDKQITKLHQDLKGKKVVYANNIKDRPLPTVSFTTKTSTSGYSATTDTAAPEKKGYTAAASQDGKPTLSNPDKGQNPKLPAVGKALTKKEMANAKVIELGGTMPQSSHPYSNYMDTAYTYRVTLASNKAPLWRVALCFNRNTYFENGYDYLYVYDGDGNYVGRYTGNSLAQKYIMIDTDKYYYLRLVTDSSVTKYGFKVDKVYAFCQPAITSIAKTSSGKPEIRFTRNSDANTYILERATVDKKTGAVSSYKKISSGKPSAKKFVDNSAKAGVLYKYRLRMQYKFMNSTYSSPNTYKSYYTGSQKPSIKTISIVNNGTSVQLEWTSTGVMGYNILRSTSANGTYTLVGSTAARSFTDTPSTSGIFYYKIRPYVTSGSSKFYFPTSSAKSVFLGTPNITSVMSNSNGNPLIKWKNLPGQKGYEIRRASIDMTTGEIGSFKTIINKTSSATSYTDETTSLGKAYAYRIRVFTKNGSTKVYSNAVIKRVYTMKPTTITSATASSSTTAPTVTLNWKNMGSKFSYQVQRAPAGSSTYTEVAKVSGTTYTELLPSASQYSYKVRPYIVIAGTTYYGPMSSVKTVGPASNPITYRALVIGQKYAGTSSELFGTLNDARGMRSMLQNMTSTPYTVTYKSDLTASGIKSAIASVFGQADSNDVTLLYYSGHGVYSTSSTSLGALCGTSNTYIYPYELRNVLDQYQGKKVVMIDACHSGNMIGKAAGDESIDAFMDAFMEPFKNAPKASNNLAASGYYVLTAAHSSTSSYETSFSGVRMGVFTYALTYGCGWNMQSSSKISTLYADANGNKKITLDELFDYTRSRVSALGYGSSQQCQVYPENSSQVLFGR